MKQIINFFRRSFFRIAIFAFVIYIFITVGRSIWHNYQINKEIDALNVEINELKLVNESLSNKIAYYKTNTYKELAMREKLNFQKPGETMVILPKEQKENKIISPETIAKPINVHDKPNYQLWIEYFKK